MYKIIGANGAVYGPVTAEQLRQWIAEGRVNAQSQAQLEGETTWKAITEFPEFAANFVKSTPPLPPPPLASGMGSAPQAFQTGLNNPYGRQLALDQISGPAIGLMVAGGLGIALAIIGLINSAIGQNFAMQILANAPNQNPEMLEMIKSMQTAGRASGMIFGIIQLCACIFIIFAATKMKNLQEYGVSLAGAIICVIPCIGPCCLFGIPLGIWALVVLNKAEVKSQFT